MWTTLAIRPQHSDGHLELCVDDFRHLIEHPLKFPKWSFVGVKHQQQLLFLLLEVVNVGFTICAFLPQPLASLLHGNQQRVLII